MPVRKLNGFIGGAYELRSKNLDAQRCINLYPVIDETGQGKDGDVGMLIGCPGLRPAIATSGEIRAIYVSSFGVMYTVNGNSVYSFDNNFMATLIGTLTTTVGRVSIADNGVQLMIVDGVDGYIYTFSSGVFAQVTDPDMPASTSVKFLDGYFLLNQVGTGRFFITSLYDGFNIDSLDFATVEGSPDNLLAIEVLQRQAWMFGTQSTQCYFNSGDADFPIVPVNGVFIEVGLAAANSVVKVDQTILWLGSNLDGRGVVYMANGYQPFRVSTTAIELAIQNYADISTATAFGYQQEGHTFYVINFGEASWVYDLNTKLWHQRAHLTDGIFTRYRANTHAYFSGMHLVGDYETGIIYELDFDYFKDNDMPRKWLRSTPHVASNLNYLYYKNFQVDLEFGAAGNGINPVLMMRTSDDGGHSWSNERTQTMGAIGEFKARANFARCGRSRDRIFEISGTDPVKVALLGAYVDIEEGSR